MGRSFWRHRLIVVDSSAVVAILLQEAPAARLRTRLAFEGASIISVANYVETGRVLAQRKPDRIAGIAFTHGLTRLFGGGLPLAGWPRGVGLALFDALPLARRAFTRAMLFGF